MTKSDMNQFQAIIEKGQETRSCANAILFLDKLFVIGRITGEEYDILSIKARRECAMGKEVSQEVMTKYVDNQIKVCKQLGCRLTENKTILYNPYNGIKVSVDMLYNLKSKDAVQKALHAIKVE